jgi:hypothetical protein
MNRNYVNLLLRIAAALYFSINGIMAIMKNEYSEFANFAEFIFGKSESQNIALIFIIVCLFAGSIWLLLPLLKIEIPILDTILLYQSYGWIFYIMGYDIIYTILNKVNILFCLKDFAIHLMVLGIMFASVRRIGFINRNKS